MRLPNFLIIGAQRSGTTWLYQMLRSHPDIYLPQTKEPEFFSYRDRIEDLGIEGYAERYFADAAEERAVGEATPSYLWVSAEHPDWCERPPGFNGSIPEDVDRFLGPDVRFIVSLRDPVKRAASAFLHHVRLGRLSPERSILNVGRQAGIVHMGFYGAHLSTWLSVHPKDRFEILVFEDATGDAASTFADLCRFLSVRSVELPERAGSRVNRAAFRSRWVDGAFEVELDSTWHVLVSADEAAELRSIYAADRSRLEELIDVDLACWER